VTRPPAPVAPCFGVKGGWFWLLFDTAPAAVASDKADVADLTDIADMADRAEGEGLAPAPAIADAAEPGLTAGTVEVVDGLPFVGPAEAGRLVGIVGGNTGG